MSRSEDKQDHINKYRSQNLRFWLYAFLLLLVFAYFGTVTDFFNIKRYIEGYESFKEIVGFAFPLDFSNAKLWPKALWETIAMSIVGTMLAIALSLFLGFLAAKNTSPHPSIYWFTRSFLNLMRSIPELIMGIILVACVGFGALPGVLALAFHSLGMVGKFFAETIEHVNNEPIEAVRAAGGSNVQVLFHGVFPQIVPQLVDISIYRWEYNIRASTVLGIIGTGGIGYYLYIALQIFNYQEATALLVVILIMVTLVDILGAFIRRLLK